MPAETPTFDTVIGVDCATQPENTSLALARYASGTWHLLEAQDGERHGEPAGVIAPWASGRQRVLIALDAPLGWPAAMAPTLTPHVAGDPIFTAPAHLFARETDRHVHATYRKKPLDVGADRIARTAVAALLLLDAVRDLTGFAIPLWWDEPVQHRNGDVGPEAGSGEAPALAPAHAVEVYPAATLRAHGVDATGYKKANDGPGRRAVAALLSSHLRLPERFDASSVNDDAIDAALCVLAGLDVASGHAVGPTLEQRAASRSEGWIWVRRPLGA